MKTFGFDYLMVATLADTRMDNERQAQYFRELRREAELQERSRHAWKARREAVRSMLASVVKRLPHAGNGGQVATAS